MIQLGQKYKDKITGFEGVATGRCAYISVSDQVLLAPKCGDDGSSKDSHWFDVQRVEAIGEEIITLDNSKTPGCDRAAPKR
jgi:hypothetical protein